MLNSIVALGAYTNAIGITKIFFAGSYGWYQPYNREWQITLPLSYLYRYDISFLDMFVPKVYFHHKGYDVTLL